MSIAVFLFQSAIFLTLFISWRYKIWLGVIVTIIWLLITIDRLYGDLFLIQFSTLVFSTVVSYSSRTNENLIGKFINNLLGLQQIKGPTNHRNFLIKSVKSSKKDLIIVSGWATSFALDAELTTLLKKAINRGVNIYICFGYKYSRDTRKRLSDIKGLEILRTLQDHSNTNKAFGNIYISQIPNHSKILICDKKYYVVGSFNWLSNSGSTNNPNNETSVIITNLSIILNSYDDLKSEIIENAE